MLKVSADCKKAIDAYFDGLRQIDEMPGLSPEQRATVKAKTTKNIVSEPGWKDKMAELVINSYISALGTPAVNLLSALVKAPLLIAERAIVSMIPGNNVKFQEVYGMTKGFFEGMAEGIDFMKAGWAAGMPLDSKVNVDVMSGIGKGASLNEPPDPNASALKQAYQRIARPLEKAAAPYVSAPTRAGVAVDEMSKAVFRRMQMNALAYRISQTVPESKLGGKTRDEIYSELRAIDIGDATKAGDTAAWRAKLSGVAPDIADELTNFARVNTFQADLGKVGNFLLKARREHPELVFIAPFIKTPINILKDALSYTPAALFMKQFKGKKEEAAARMIIGAGIASMVGQQVVSGNLTGSYPKDSNRRESMIAQGIPEYSVKIGDQWYSYARIEPLASVMGIFADSMESLVDYYTKPNAERKIQELATDGVLAITKNLASKTFLEGISGMLQAVHDPERYGGSFINGFATVLVPGAVAQFARGTDPVQRDVRSFADAIQNRIPGLRTDLPTRYDILGEERRNPAFGVMGSLGIATKPAEQTPLQKELGRVNFAYTAPSRKLRGVELNATDYEKYSKISGDKIDKALERVTQTEMYKQLPRARQKYMLEQVAARARKSATTDMLVEKRKDPEFYKELTRVRLSKKGRELEEE